MLTLLGSTGWAHAARITVLLSEATPDYQAVAHAMVATLGAEAKSNLEVQIVPLAEWQNGVTDKSGTLLVAVGVAAMQAALDTKARMPILATLIPKQAFEKAMAGRSEDSPRMTALYLDQPIERYLALIRAALPRAQSFGILLSAQTQNLSGGIRNGASRLELTPVINTLSGERDLFPSLLQVMPQVDAMLAIPDNAVINRLTIRNFLLATYRNHVPVFGYAHSQVSAGMLAAVFSTPAQIGEGSGEMVRQILRGNWQLPSYPKAFSVKVNDSVARSLSLTLPAEGTLVREIRKLTEGD